MSWVGVAVSVAGTIYSASQQADAAEGASAAQGESSAAAIGEQRRQYDQSRTDMAPWRETGSAAQKRLAALLGLTTFDETGWNDAQRLWNAKDAEGNFFQRVGAAPTRDSFVSSGAGDPEFGSLNKRFTLADRDADPVYKSGLEFGLKEGEGAINARALAGGMYDSGATLKALTRFGNDYGSTKANESRNRFVSDQDTTFNRLTGVSGSGQTATAQTNAAGANMTNNVTDLITGAGNARAAGIVGGANAWGGAASGVNNTINNYQSNQTLQKLLAGRSGGGTFSPYYTGYDASGGGAAYGKEGGLLIGPKHEAGGIALEAEGGEVLIPADVVKKKGVKFFQRLMAENRAH